MNKKIVVISLFFFIFFNCFSQQIWTIGPMVHYNFNNGKNHFSYALECSFWNLEHFFYSIDGGIEFESKKIRIYSELQTGILVAGISLGPLLEINTNENKTHFGIQSSIWANYLIGVDYRMRWVNKEKSNCIGLYFKLPIADSGFSSSSRSSHHHYSDWDWD